jgi:hypothetical protein
LAGGVALNCVANDALGKVARHEAALVNAFLKTLQIVFILQRNAARKAKRGRSAAH